MVKLKQKKFSFRCRCCISSLLPSNIKKIVISEPTSNSWLPNMPKIAPKTLVIFDAYVSLNTVADFNSYLLSPSYKTAKNTQVFIPTTSFWNENRIYKSQEGRILHTPTFCNFYQILCLSRFLFYGKNTTNF